jgi:hypothetical protein
MNNDSVINGTGIGQFAMYACDPGFEFTGKTYLSRCILRQYSNIGLGHRAIFADWFVWIGALRRIKKGIFFGGGIFSY